jgi:hypothetical protein
MRAAEVLAADISEPLTWDEICVRHPDAWVCLAEMDRIHPNDFEFRTARVIGHGKTQGESLDRAMAAFPRYDDIGHFYTSELELTYFRPVVIIDDETRDAFRYPR